MKRLITLILIALVLGAFAAFGTFQVQSQADIRALEKFETAEVWVTTADVPALISFDEAIAQNLIEKVKYPIQYLPETALLTANSANLNGFAFRQLAADQLLLQGDFGNETQTESGLSIPNGFVAVGLDLPAANRAGGFLQPGRRVALVSTVPNSGNSQGTYTTKTLASGLQVLSVGTNRASDISLSQGTGESQNIVTLAVRPVDVENILNAAEAGSISLVLLSDGAQLPVNGSPSR